MKTYKNTTTKTGFNARIRKSATISAMLLGRSGEVIDYIQTGEDTHKAALSWGEWRAENINEEYAGQVAKMIIYCGEVEVAFIEIEQEQEQERITTPDTLNTWTAAHAEQIENGSRLSLYVENVSDIYTQFEWLCACCLKKFRKFGGLDLDYLKESATLKAITRAARKYAAKYGEHYTMDEDRAARAYLAASVFDYCAEAV